MSNQQQQQEVRMSMEEAQHRIKLYTALQKLQNNKYFKELFLDGYLDKYASRLVKAKADPGMQSVENQQYSANQLNAIGHLNQYLIYVSIEGRMAEKALEDLEVEKEIQLREEQERAGASE
jgi:hypothetical protein